MVVPDEMGFAVWWRCCVRLCFLYHVENRYWCSHSPRGLLWRVICLDCFLIRKRHSQRDLWTVDVHYRGTSRVALRSNCRVNLRIGQVDQLHRRQQRLRLRLRERDSLGVDDVVRFAKAG